MLLALILLLAGDPLGVRFGGTGASVTPTAGGLCYGTGSALAVNAAGSAGQCAMSGGAGAPTWGTCGLTSVFADVPLIGDGTSGSHLQCRVASASQSGCVASADFTTFNGKAATGTCTAQFMRSTSSSAVTCATVSLTADVSGVTPIANGGTNGTATPTDGGVAYGTGAAYAFTDAGTPGQCLAAGDAGVPIWVTCSAGGSRRTSGTGAYVSWPITESATSYVNEGTAGTNANLDTQSGGVNVVTRKAGLFYNKLFSVGGAAGLYASNSGALNQAAPFTLTVWYRSTSIGFNTGLFWKLYRPVASGFTSPFLTWSLRVENTSGVISFYATISGTLKSTSTASPDVVVSDVWHLVGATLDGANNAQIGIDGVWVKSAAFGAGSLDFGTNGQLGVGQAPNEGTTGITYNVADLRQESGVMSAADFEARYRTGPGGF